MIDATLHGTLWVHVAAGVVALVAGLAAMATEKGGPRHRRAGRTYVVAMAVVVTTAVPLALVEGNYFLFAIAVFSGYLVLVGYRVIARKRPTPGEAATVDWVAHLGMVVTGVGMVALGGYDLATGDPLGTVLVVFGVIGLALSVRELRSIYRPPDRPRAWFYRHIVFVAGAYIATVTAAVTVNLETLPPVVRWVGPTVVGTPAILATVWRYRRRFEDE